MSSIGFIIIGAQKAGTTSLFEYMRRHPQIYMPADKEVGFFHVDRHYRRGWDWYQTLMLRDAPADSIAGEASVGYMSGTPFGDTVANESWNPQLHACCTDPLEEIVPRRIKTFLPKIKLICVLRDPVARAYSHYRMAVLDKVESRSFDEAIRQLIAPHALASARVAPTRTNSYIVNGEYGRILAGFLRVFPPEQLLVLFSQDLVRQPAETLASVFAFVGVAHDYIPENLNTQYRGAATKQRIPGMNLYTWQLNIARAHTARSLWHALPSRVRKRIDRGYSVASYRVALWNAQRGAVDYNISPSALERLTTHFQPDGEALSHMLGQEVPWMVDSASFVGGAE